MLADLLMFHRWDRFGTSEKIQGLGYTGTLQCLSNKDTFHRMNLFGLFPKFG